MLEGWYCRTLANEKAGAQQDEPNVDVDGESGSDDSRSPQKVNATNDTNQDNPTTQVDYKAQYRYLKKKLKFLIYENEFFQDALRSNQRRLLKVSRDRAFLLDRLLNYEKPDDNSDSDQTESSEDDAAKEVKKRKTDTGASGTNVANSGRGRKRKIPNNEGPQQKSVIVEKAVGQLQANLNAQEHPQEHQLQQQQQSQNQSQQQQQQSQMTLLSTAEVERHLQSRQTVLELMPEHASATVPTEMFSNEPSLDGEPHEQYGSPTHVAAEECVQMEYAN